MKKSHRVNASGSASGKGRSVSRSVLVLVVFLAVAATGAALYLLPSSSSSGRVSAQSARGDQKRFKATRKIVVDKDSGEARMPTEEELDKLVSDLRELTKRDEGLPQQSVGDQGMVALDLEGGFGGTFLARPRADGTMETRCVFSFDEAAEFMGLVEETF